MRWMLFLAHGRVAEGRKDVRSVKQAIRAAQEYLKRHPDLYTTDGVVLFKSGWSKPFNPYAHRMEAR